MDGEHQSPDRDREERNADHERHEADRLGARERPIGNCTKPAIAETAIGIADV